MHDGLERPKRPGPNLHACGTFEIDGKIGSFFNHVARGQLAVVGQKDRPLLAQGFGDHHTFMVGDRNPRSIGQECTIVKEWRHVHLCHHQRLTRCYKGRHVWRVGMDDGMPIRPGLIDP